MLRRLPPLGALRAFEAAARLGSFSAAADELSVTHGAVSRQIRNLEDWLGVALFLRLGKRVQLTDAARAYLAGVQSAFDGIAAATTRVLALAGARPADVERFIHGTTIATNAILEQKGATTAILTTEGFEDVLELGRMKRSRMYDLGMDPEVPTFLAPRRRRLGIRERLDARGHVLVPLHEDDVRAAVSALRAQGVAAVAVFGAPRAAR